jgi:hypothetical protein
MEEVTPAIFDSRITTSQNCERFREGLVFKVHRLVYHSTLGPRVIKKKKSSDAKDGKGSKVSTGGKVAEGDIDAEWKK